MLLGRTGPERDKVAKAEMAALWKAVAAKMGIAS
jgi:hypothetical protein